ncbi:MAG TPA: hypothetical protein ENJ26_03110 [Rhodobacteraceae bacterium]|nr:hypothetical protein [Paracoccaceae bacterium]
MTARAFTAKDAPRPRILCVGTHHKTGTVWMRSVFREISEVLNIPLMGIHRPRKYTRIPDEGRVIVVNWGSRFAPELWDRPDARFFHLIRDPRDVLLSGARYHETTAMRTERFLYEPRDDLGGKSYQEHLRSLPGLEEKLAFEMAEAHRRTLAEMLDWPYGHQRALDLRYEDLIVDTKARLFAEVLEFFGFAAEEIEKGCKIFVKNSLFGGLADGGVSGRSASHVKSGKPAQWMRALPAATARLYHEKHADDLIALGYETDASWLAQATKEAAKPQPDKDVRGN